MKINIIEAQVGVETAPRVRTSPGLGLARGLVQFAGGLEDVGQSLSESSKLQLAIDRRKRTWEVETETLSKLTDFRTRLDDIHRDLEKTPPDKNGEIHENWRTATQHLKSEFGSEIMASSSPYKSDVYDLFNKNILRPLGHAEISAKQLQNNKWIDNERAKLDRIGTYVVDIADPQLVKPWGDIGRRMRDEGIVSAEDFERRFQHIKNGVQVNLKRIEDEARRQQEKAAETRADRDLDFRFPGDYDSQIKALGDPKQYEPLGLTAERARNLADIINGRRTRDQKVIDEAQEQTDRDFTVRMTQGTLTREMVADAVSRDLLKPAIGKAYIHHLDQELERAAVKEKVETDFSVYADLRSKALAVRTLEDQRAFKEEWIRNFGKLSEKDREKLIDLALREEDQTTKDAMAVAEKEMRSQISPSQGLFPANPETDKRFYLAAEALREEVERARRSEKPMTADQIKKRAREITPIFQMTPVDYMQSEKKQMESMIKSLGGQKPGWWESLWGRKQTPVLPPPKGQYEIDQVYTDGQGRKAKYLGPDKEGRDQWQLVK